jgi:hypothetical protein
VGWSGAFVWDERAVLDLRHERLEDAVRVRNHVVGEATGACHADPVAAGVLASPRRGLVAEAQLSADVGCQVDILDARVPGSR